MRLVVGFFIPILALFLSLPAQAQTPAASVKAQATAMVNALAKRDYNTFSSYLHPKMIAMAGGKNKLLQRMDTAQALMKQFGAEMKRIVIGVPGPILVYKNTTQTTIPQSTEMTSAMGGIALESTLIGLSADGGKTWRFLDTSIYPIKDIRKAVPEVSPDLVVPAPKPPRMIPNKQ